jgi:hypothetical protein
MTKILVKCGVKIGVKNTALSRKNRIKNFGGTGAYSLL